MAKKPNAMVKKLRMDKMAKKLQVGAYGRVSTDKKDQANSYASQKKFFTEKIQQNPNWELVKVYADKGLSGTTTNKRKQFQEMIQDAKDGKLDLILTKEISRFARNTLDSIEYTRMLKKLGVGVLFVNDGINTMDGDGELRLTIMAGIAQDESRKTSQRVKWGQTRRMEQGVVFGRNNMLGYIIKSGKMYVNPAEAETVRIIFRKYLEGKGTHVIARELTEMSIKPKSAKEWSNTMILKILRNEKYVGDLCQKKTYTPDFLDHKKKYNNGQEEKIYIKDHHEGIIDRETWDEVQDELQRRTTTKEMKSKHSNRYWCSGKIICGICGNKYVSRTKTLKSGEQYKAWRCAQAAKHGTKKKDQLGNDIGCNSGYLNDIALQNVASHILSLVDADKEKIVNELEQDIKRLLQEQDIQDTGPIKKEIESITRKKAKIIDAMLEGVISKDDVKLMNEQYDAEIQQLEEQIEKAENVNETNRKQAKDIEKYVKRINELVFDIEDAENREEVLKAMVDKVVVYEDNILDVYLACLPDPIKIQYSKTGKNGKYRMEYKVIGQ